jgi:hypothetical protein
VRDRTAEPEQEGQGPGRGTHDQVERDKVALIASLPAAPAVQLPDRNADVRAPAWLLRPYRYET